MLLLPVILSKLNVFSLSLLKSPGLELQPSLKTQVKTTSGNGNGKGGTVAAGNGEGGAQRERETRLGRLPSNRKQQPPSNEVTIDGKEAKMGSSIFDDLVDVSLQDLSSGWSSEPQRGPTVGGKIMGARRQ